MLGEYHYNILMLVTYNACKFLKWLQQKLKETGEVGQRVSLLTTNP